jgi:hypothetical protein
MAHVFEEEGGLVKGVCTVMMRRIPTMTATTTMMMAR